MDVIEFTKPCSKCKIPQLCSPIQERSAFYKRSGIENPIHAGHYNSSCKTCMKDQQAQAAGIPLTEPRAASEKLAIAYLTDHHLPSLPGKALGAADVDVVVWGCVWIEVKWSPLEWHRAAHVFKFNTTLRQQQRGFLAHLVMLMCQYPDDTMTHHFFKATDPVFYINGHIKSGITFQPDLIYPLRHGNNRVVMTQPMMDNARDRLELIEETRLEIAFSLSKEKSHA